MNLAIKLYRWLKVLRTRSNRWLRLGLIGLLGSWFLLTAGNLLISAASPVDAFLVLGGSIRREMHMAEVAKKFPEVPVLISQGSLDPCILILFQRVQAPIQQVWLEKCANSTFGNFYYSLPILQQWHVRKVKLVTSAKHFPRAQWMAQILLGARGIWVELDPVYEAGVPANHESWWKTGLDVGRSLLWAVGSQFYAPACSEVMPLAAVDLSQWEQWGFRCEHQAGIQPRLPQSKPSSRFNKAIE